MGMAEKAINGHPDAPTNGSGAPRGSSSVQVPRMVSKSKVSVNEGLQEIAEVTSHDFWPRKGKKDWLVSAKDPGQSNGQSQGRVIGRKETINGQRVPGYSMWDEVL